MRLISEVEIVICSHLIGLAGVRPLNPTRMGVRTAPPESLLVRLAKVGSGAWGIAMLLQRAIRKDVKV